jgi:hypothetical protein
MVAANHTMIPFRKVLIKAVKGVNLLIATRAAVAQTHDK